MNRKGFTLVELLAIIVIMALLIIVAVPNVMSISRNINKRLYCEKIENIETAATKYVEDNYEDKKVNSKDLKFVDFDPAITIGDLIINSYLNTDSKDCFDAEHADHPVKCITNPMAEDSNGEEITDANSKEYFLDLMKFDVYSKNKKFYVVIHVEGEDYCGTNEKVQSWREN